MNEYLTARFGLDGRRAAVTGAGRGIGRAIAEALAAAGAEVLVHYHRSRQPAEEAARGIESRGGRAWTAQADLTDSAQVRRLFRQVEERWGGLDILVNNTGDLVQRSSIGELSDELLERVVRVNLHSALYCSREAIPLLRRGTAPCIVNLSSNGAHTGGGAGAVLYCAAKGAIHTFTRGLATELAPGIRVNAIAPGTILTDFHRVHTPEERLAAMAANTPLKRLGEAEDVSAAVVFLCGAGAAFITGEVIEINGGLTMA